MARGLNKEQILEAGMGLIYAQGYNATSIQDIANAAGVPKGSFYNYFKSKEDFAIEIIDRYTARTVSFLQDNLLQENGLALPRLKKMLTIWADKMFVDYEGCGCLVGNISQEMGNQSEKIRSTLNDSFKRLEACFNACLEEAQVNGEIDSQINAQKLGAFIYNGWQGSLIRSKAEGNNRQLKSYVDYVFLDILSSIKQEQ